MFHPTVNGQPTLHFRITLCGRSRLDGSERLQITYSPFIPSMPRWSPDGKQIVFPGIENGKVQKIYIVSANGGTPQEFVPEESGFDDDASWSADGNSLADRTAPSWAAKQRVTSQRLVLNQRDRRKLQKNMVGTWGLEPQTSTVSR
jgi:dipeptidyl aminopeptidase/acylaminoacyl peptidase